MASNITYPDKHAVWFIEGNNLCLVTNTDSSGNASTTTSGRKTWKAIQESVTDGVLMYYNAEPNKVSSINDSLDIDNTFEKGIVEYVKKCLYMDRAGKTPDANQSQIAMAMSQMHDRNWKEISVKAGMQKRDKTGGTRVIKPFNMQ